MNLNLNQSREERKMEAIMKAFERMEKAEQRRQEALARMAHRKDGKDDDCLGLDADVEQPLSPPSSDATTTALTESSTMTMLLTDRKNSNTYDTKSKALRRTIPMRKRGGGTRLRRTSSGTGVGSAGNILAPGTECELFLVRLIPAIRQLKAKSQNMAVATAVLVESARRLFHETIRRMD